MSHAHESLRHRLFGQSSLRRVALRMAVDVFVANCALVLAALVRLAVRGQVGLDNSLSLILERVNPFYLMHVGWLTGTALVLFTLCGLYRPVPSSSFSFRLKRIGIACLAGLLLHLGFGLFALRGDVAIVEVAIPAWLVTGFSVAGIRLTRMYASTKYRLVPRGEAVNPRGTVEDILVVGGAGYIGSILVRQLLDAGYRVRILDLFLFGDDSLQEIRHHKRLEVVRGDFRNIEDVVRALRGIDAVVHLAAIVGDPACALDGDTTISVNYQAACMMAHVCRANGISRFLFASTCSVYGESEEIATETSELNPVSLYATTKIDAERALLDARDDVFQPTILRFATAYGWSHRPRFDLVANLFSAQAVTEGKIVVYNGEQWRPFVHTYDIARACVMALQAPLEKVGGEIFNVGDESQNYTLEQLGDLVGQAAPGTFVAKVRNDDDPRNYRVSFAKIQSTLGFYAQVDLKEGVQEIVNAVQAGKVRNWRDPIYSNVRTLEQELDMINALQSGTEFREMVVTRQFLERNVAESRPSTAQTRTAPEPKIAERKAA